MNVRARKEEDKQARRDSILAVVSTCLHGRPFGEVTMAEIAQRCGLAKGTLYLYFQAKEELFLAALGCEIAGWLDDLSGLLHERGTTDANGFADVVVRTLTQRETLVELLPLQRTLLEQSGASQTATRFTKTLQDKLRSTGGTVEHALPLTAGEGTRVLLRTLALVVGLRQIPDPSLGLADESGSHPVLPADFQRELRDSLSTLVTGMLASSDVRPRSSATPQWTPSSSVTAD